MFKPICILFFFTIFFCKVFCQDLPLPINHPIAIAAPHLPLMIKYDGQGLVYTIENTRYKFDVIERDVKSWMRNYPEELVKYKAAIYSFLKIKQPITLPADRKNIYNDLKSQWLLIAQF